MTKKKYILNTYRLGGYINRAQRKLFNFLITQVLWEYKNNLPLKI